MKIVKFIVVVVCLLPVLGVIGQDTTHLIKEFNKVMSFSVEPYLYYTTTTKMAATPIIQTEDTSFVTGEFYKNHENIYYGNQLEMMFLEDSFLVQVNKKRKSIWISKVDESTKGKMNLIPLQRKELQDLFKEKYVISKTEISEQSNRLNFETKQYFDSVSMVIVNIGLQYSTKKFAPELLQMNVSMKQLVNNEMIKQLQEQGTEVANLVKVVENNKYLVRNQQVSVSFENISYSKEKATQMPSWKNLMDLDLKSNEFIGKGEFGDYEITKTF